jgi:hypothetical protein
MRFSWGAAMAHDGLFQSMLDLYILEFKFKHQGCTLTAELAAQKKKKKVNSDTNWKPGLEQ